MRHLHKEVLIRAPLKRVLEVARDPRHWSDWYVGVSEACELPCDEATGRHEYLTVGMRFPLAGPLLEELSSPDRAEWIAHDEETPECARVGTCCTQVMIGGEQRWTYTSHDGSTEVEVDVDFEAPVAAAGRRIDPTVVDSLEAQVVERSLSNLRELCE